jgi:hypothetical protein
MSSYSTIYRIVIGHEFFEENVCRFIKISPTPECKTHLNNLGMIINQFAINEWHLLVPGDDLHKEKIILWLQNNDQSLDFDMEVIQTDFFHCTNWPEFSYTKNYEFQMEPNGINVLLSENELVFGLIEDKKTVPVSINTNDKKQNISSVCKLCLTFSEEIINNIWSVKNRAEYNIKVQYNSLKVIWEFILIPRNSTNNKTLVLKEVEERLELSQLDEIEVTPGQLAYKGYTTELIPLKENYNYQIQLWELRDSGKKMILEDMPLPKAGEFSKNYSNNNSQIITKFYYF